MNASEVSENEECLSKELSLKVFACVSKVPEGLGINEL